MGKTKLEIDMPSELLFSLRETEETFKEKAKVWLATKMFEEGHVIDFDLKTGEIVRKITVQHFKFALQ